MKMVRKTVAPADTAASVMLLELPELKVWQRVFELSPAPPAFACRWVASSTEEKCLAAGMFENGLLEREKDGDRWLYGVDRKKFTINDYAVCGEEIIRREELSVSERLRKERLGIK